MTEEQGGSRANSGRWPNEGLTKSICRAQLGELISHEGLTIYPLFTPDGHEPKYELLEDALKNETAIVTEASTGGSVPELLIENRGDKPILILEGDVLIGAKQNRRDAQGIRSPNPAAPHSSPPRPLRRALWSVLIGVAQ